MTHLKPVGCCALYCLQLEEQIRQAQEQKQHVAVQLEQLEGCESSRDNLGISDLRAQLQVRLVWRWLPCPASELFTHSADINLDGV